MSNSLYNGMLYRVTYSKFGHVQAETISARDEQEVNDIFEGNGCRVMEVKPAFPAYQPTASDLEEAENEQDARQTSADDILADEIADARREAKYGKGL